MTTKTRYFLISSGLIVVVVLGTGLVAYYNGGLPLRASTVGPAELTYVSSDATAVAYADVHQILQSDFCKKLQAEAPTGAGRNELLTQTGIDIEHDIDTVVSSVGPAGPSAGALVLIRGHFNVPQVEKVIQDHGATAETYRGVRILDLPGGSTGSSDKPAASGATQFPGVSGEGGGAIAFIEPGLLALGSVATVKRALDTAAGHDDVTKDADLMHLVSTVARTSNAWVVGDFDTLAKDAHLQPPAGTQLPAVRWVAVGAQVDRSLNGHAYAEAKDEKSGDQLRAVINGALAAAKMMAGDDPKAGAILNNLQATGSGKSVEIAFTLPPDILDNLHGMLPSAVPSWPAASSPARPAAN